MVGCSKSPVLAYALLRLFCGALAFLCVLMPHTPAQAVDLQNIWVGEHKGHQRMVLSLENEATYKIFTLDNPTRLVIDIAGASWAATLPDTTHAPLISAVRYGNFKPGALRIVADINGPLPTFKSAILPADAKDSFRIVVDFMTEKKFTEKDLAPLPPPPETQPKGLQKEPKGPAKAEAAAKLTPVPVVKPKAPRPPGTVTTIIIDPGHGGDDPGATSLSGVNEKELTLRYAQTIKKTFEKTGRYEVILTRTNDTYIRLRDRILLARNKGGQLFISLHADSHPSREMRGLSVYTLSGEGTDKEAELLAQRENRSDIIGGMDLSDTAPDVAGILIDLAQRETNNRSNRFAELLVKALSENDLPVVRNAHRSAGFAVLKAPDIPSVLLEMGYLSNMQDERMLRSAEHEKKMAAYIVKAVDSYFED